MLIKNYREKNGRKEGRRVGRKKGEEGGGDRGRKGEKEDWSRFLSISFVNTSQCMGRQRRLPFDHHLCSMMLFMFSVFSIGLARFLMSMLELSLFYLLLFSHHPVNVVMSRSLGPGVGGAG